MEVRVGKEHYQKRQEQSLCYATFILKLRRFVHFPSELLASCDLLNITPKESSFTKNFGAWVLPASPGSIDQRLYTLSRAMVLNMWSPDRQHHHHLGTC